MQTHPASHASASRSRERPSSALQPSRPLDDPTRKGPAGTAWGLGARLAFQLALQSCHLLLQGSLGRQLSLQAAILLLELRPHSGHLSHLFLVLDTQLLPGMVSEKAAGRPEAAREPSASQLPAAAPPGAASGPPPAGPAGRPVPGPQPPSASAAGRRPAPRPAPVPAAAASPPGEPGAAAVGVGRGW